MAATMAELWKERASQPPKFDLISMMAHSDATRAMPTNEFIGNFALLIVGGNDTTRNTMSGSLLAFAEYPEERAKLEASEALLPSAGGGDDPLADAGDPHAPHRHARHRARRQGHQQGDKVVMWYVSGNRDESVHAEPDALRIERPKVRQHLSFGAGIHRCVGDRLAELQLQVLWREMLKRNLRPEITGEPVRHYSNFLRGIRSLPVIIRA